MDSSVPEKFGSMLKTALESMSLVLELATVEDVGKVGDVFDINSKSLDLCVVAYWRNHWVYVHCCAVLPIRDLLLR